MTWRRIGDKPLSEPLLTQFTDAYMRGDELKPGRRKCSKPFCVLRIICWYKPSFKQSKIWFWSGGSQVLFHEIYKNCLQNAGTFPYFHSEYYRVVYSWYSWLFMFPQWCNGYLCLSLVIRDLPHMQKISLVDLWPCAKSSSFTLVIWSDLVCLVGYHIPRPQRYFYVNIQHGSQHV